MFPTRRRLVWPLTLVSWLALSSLGLAAHAQMSQGPLEIERKELFSQLAAGESLWVENLFGDLRLRFGGYEGVVESRAVFQQMAGEGPRLELEALPQAEGDQRGWTVRVGFREGASFLRSPQPGHKKRADLVVLVPLGVRVVAKTQDGTLQIRGIKGAVEATTRGGKIEARSVEGSLQLETQSGAILAALESLGAAKPQVLRSQSGKIELYLRDDGHFRVEGRTRGLLTTDFTTEIAARDPSDLRHKSFLTRLGKETTPVAIDAGTGAVVLRRKPSAAEARARQAPTDDSP